VFPLGECQGDCDSDSECSPDLVCFQRSGTQSVPGCKGSGQSGSDYCVKSSNIPPAPAPAPAPSDRLTIVGDSEFLLQLSACPCFVNIAALSLISFSFLQMDPPHQSSHLESAKETVIMTNNVPLAMFAFKGLELNLFQVAEEVGKVARIIAFLREEHPSPDLHQVAASVSNFTGRTVTTGRKKALNEDGAQLMITMVDTAGMAKTQEIANRTKSILLSAGAATSDFVLWICPMMKC